MTSGGGIRLPHHHPRRDWTGPDTPGLARNEATLPTITSSDGVRLSYLEMGDPTARPVVLVAGFKAPATSWRYQLKPLARAGYRVIAFDRRGHGASGIGEGEHTMDRHGADIHDLLTALELEDVTLVGQSMGGNAIWALVQQFGTEGIRDVVIVDQTPKMLNTADWPYGFYDYDETNADTYFATGIPDPGRHPVKSKGLVRISRVLKAMELPKGGRPTFTAAELALLNDHAKRDWRPVLAAARPPRVLHRRRRERVLAGRARRGIRSPERPRLVDGHRARRPRREHRAAAAVQRGAARVPPALSAERVPSASRAARRHCRSRTQSHASRCARCTASPIHSELSYTRSGPRRSSRPPAASWSASRSPATTSQSVEPCCSRSSR